MFYSTNAYTFDLMLGTRASVIWTDISLSRIACLLFPLAGRADLGIGWLNVSDTPASQHSNAMIDAVRGFQLSATASEYAFVLKPKSAWPGWAA